MKVFYSFYLCRKHRKEVIEEFDLHPDYWCSDKDFPSEICSVQDCSEDPVVRNITSSVLTYKDW